MKFLNLWNRFILYSCRDRVLIFFSTINNLNGDQAIPTMC
jgi:hypothetical protein